MIDFSVYISKDGLEKMKAELHYLKTTKRREVADRIDRAKDLGDLRENADYVEAKEEFSFIEGRVLELEDAINRAVIIEGKNGDAVYIGAKVRVKIGDKEKEFHVVGSREADPQNGYISNESPIGVALIGKHVGEFAEVKVPAGKVRYTIISIK